MAHHASQDPHACSGSLQTQPRSNSKSKSPKSESLPEGEANSHRGPATSRALGSDSENVSIKSLNSQRIKSTLDFHRTAHSFPDYGSVKGAIRMPHPGRFLKDLAPQRHVNTLNSSPSQPPKFRSNNPERAPPLDNPRPPKRAKLNSPKKPLEEIESDSDTASRAGRHESQQSLSRSNSHSHPVNASFLEFKSVESTACLDFKREKKHQQKRPNGSGFRVPVTPLSLTRPLSSMESIEDDDLDELTLSTPQHSGVQRPARVVTRPENSFNDAADRYILSYRASPRKCRSRTQPNPPKKRASSEAIEDEKKSDSPKRQKMDPKTPNEQKKSPSISHRGEITPTQWNSKSPNLSQGLRVRSALCNPDHRYMYRDSVKACTLRLRDSELRGQIGLDDSTELEWLGITKRTRTISYHPSSSIVKIDLSNYQTPSVRVVSPLVIRFFTVPEAQKAVEWAKEKLGVTVEELDVEKLESIYKKIDLNTAQESARKSGEQSQHFQSPVPQEARRHSVDVVEVSKSSVSRNKIREQMQISTQSPAPQRRSESVIYSTRSLRSATRTQSLDVSPKPAPRRWSPKQRELWENWKIPLIYERTTVEKEDIMRLDEGQFLNDNIVNFALRYIYATYSKIDNLNARVYLHNSFFYDKLKKAPKGSNGINYDGVKSWTAKVDLLSYDYVIVPVNEDFHWWVAIICNPGRLDLDARKAEDKKADAGSSDLEVIGESSKAAATDRNGSADHGKSDDIELAVSDLVAKPVRIDLTASPKAEQGKKSGSAGKRFDFKEPKIITLDSLGKTHYPAVNLLKKYLLAEFEHKRGKTITEVPAQLGMRAVNIPTQSNVYDCGIYVIEYILQFARDPDLFISRLLRRDGKEWDFDPSEMRYLLRENILLEQEKYQAKQLGEKVSRSNSLSSSQPPASAPTTPTVNGNDADASRRYSSESCSSAAEPSRPASTNATPGPGVEVHEISDSESEAKLSPAAPHSTRQSVEPSSPPKLPPRPTTPTQVPVEDKPLPSVEPSDEMEVVRSPEPKFISKIPTSSPAPVSASKQGSSARRASLTLSQRPNRPLEVIPRSFYGSLNLDASPSEWWHGCESPNTRKKRQPQPTQATKSATSPKEVGRRQSVNGTTTTPNQSQNQIQKSYGHVTSQFVLDETEPEVVSAKLIRPAASRRSVGPTSENRGGSYVVDLTEDD